MLDVDVLGVLDVDALGVLDVEVPGALDVDALGVLDVEVLGVHDVDALEAGSEIGQPAAKQRLDRGQPLPRRAPNRGLGTRTSYPRWSPSCRRLGSV